MLALRRAQIFISIVGCNEKQANCVFIEGKVDVVLVLLMLACVAITLPFTCL